MTFQLFQATFLQSRFSRENDRLPDVLHRVLKTRPFGGAIKQRLKAVHEAKPLPELAAARVGLAQLVM